MGIIKALKLGFDYFKYDDDGNIQETQRAVDKVSVDIQEGEFVAVLGHNGSGKSTFAKHINALLLPTEGTIWIDNMEHDLKDHCRRTGGDRHRKRIRCAEKPDSRKSLIAENCCHKPQKHASNHNH